MPTHVQGGRAYCGVGGRGLRVTAMLVSAPMPGQPRLGLAYTPVGDPSGKLRNSGEGPLMSRSSDAGDSPRCSAATDSFESIIAPRPCGERMATSSSIAVAFGTATATSDVPTHLFLS